jgi:sulfate permease, SulP family
MLASFAGFRTAWLPHDLVAGVMLAAIAIPEQLATARLARMPPETGIYAFAAGSIAFALFGANRFLSVGADSTIAPIFAGGIAAFATAGTQSYVAAAGVFALAVGGLLVAAGLARAGWVADLLSIPVTTGFLAGISVHITVGQLPAILGLPPESGQVLWRLADLVGRAPLASPYAVAIGGAVLAASLVAERISPRVPGALAALVAAGAVVAVFRLDERGVSVLGPLSLTLPEVALPSLAQVRDLAGLAPLALVVAMVCMMQTAAVARTFPSDEAQTDNFSRDLSGVGVGCILAGLTGAFAVNASPPRTAVVVRCGGRSQLSSLAAIALIAGAAYLASGALAYVPQAALGGILVFIAIRIIRGREIVGIFRRGGYEILLVAASAVLVVAFPIETGMLLAIVLSLLHSLYVLARPRWAQLARVPGTTIWWPPSRDETGEQIDGVLVFAPAAALNFTNAEYLRRSLLDAIARAAEPVRLVVIEASGMTAVDYTGSQILQKTVGELRKRQIDVAIARLSAERAQREAARTGLLAALGPARIFKSVEEAVGALGLAGTGAQQHRPIL